jgi:hypothetical protein
LKGKVNCATLKDMLKSVGERYTDEEVINFAKLIILEIDFTVLFYLIKFLKTLDFFENVPLEDNGKEMNYKEFSKILKNGEGDKK